MNEEKDRANGGANLPNKGTDTNVTETYGADIGGEARNRIGGIGRSTRSDPPDACKGGNRS
jgi:hypothetical protein